MNIIGRFFSGILLVVAIVVALLLLVAAYVEYLSPAHFALPALLGLGFPVIAVCAVLLFIVLLFLHRRYSLIPLVALLLSIPALWQYCPINIGNDTIDTNSDTFTLLSYNVYYFRDTEREPQNEDISYNRTLQYIIDYNADIVLLQESGRELYKSKRTKITQSQLDELKRLYPYQLSTKQNMMLSKYPAQLVKDTVYTDSANTGIYRVNIEGREVTIFNNHLESIGLSSEDKKLYVALATNPDSIPEKVSEVKSFTKKFLHAFETRASQVEVVDSLARTIGGNIIMCGDINDTPNSYAYHVLKNERDDAFLQKGVGPGFTYRANGMWVRIDHIFYEGDFVAKAVRKGNKRYSDHYPLWVEFEWK